MVELCIELFYVLFLIFFSLVHHSKSPEELA